MSKSCIECPVCLNCTIDNLAVLVRCLIRLTKNTVQCPECNENISGLDNLISHLLTHLKNKSDVQVCGSMIFPLETSSAKNITSLKSVESSPRNMTPNNKSIKTSWCCITCGLYFADESLLKSHEQMHVDKNDDKMSRFPCHLCTKAFQMRGTLMVHLRVAHYGSHHNPLARLRKQNWGCVECPPLSPPPPPPLVESVTEPQDSKQWPCEVCQKSFTTKYFLKKHKRLHTGETPYCCQICNKSFTFQQSYHKHLLYHNDEKPYVCSECGRAFKELSTLHNHQRIHTGERPFACESCGKCFRQRVSYLVHRRIHTGVLPYKCTACNKSFRYKVSQRTHKCPAQPPGEVVRQPVNLLEKIMKNLQENSDTKANVEAQTNEDIIRRSAKLSLEDTELENFSIFHLGNDNSNLMPVLISEESDEKLIDKFPRELIELSNLESVLGSF